MPGIIWLVVLVMGGVGVFSWWLRRRAPRSVGLSAPRIIFDMIGGQ